MGIWCSVVKRTQREQLNTTSSDDKSWIIVSPTATAARTPSTTMPCKAWTTPRTAPTNRNLWRRHWADSVDWWRSTMAARQAIFASRPLPYVWHKPPSLHGCITQAAWPRTAASLTSLPTTRVRPCSSWTKGETSCWRYRTASMCRPSAAESCPKAGIM